MYRTGLIAKTLAGALFGASLWGISGCGGGASTVPTVVLKKSVDTAPAGGGGAPDTDGGAAPAAGGGAPAPGGIGSLVGKVVFDGTPPTLSPLVAQGDQAAKDANVCAVEAVPDESLVVTDGGIQNVFIFLEKAPSGAAVEKPAEEQVLFDQKGCRFIPHALLVQVGQTVQVVSGDPIPHNTHTYPGKNAQFNNLVAANDRTGLSLVYKSAEKQPFAVKCDYHAWMSAYHLPLDHPFAAVTGPDGSFRIDNLPTGQYKFKIWHEKGGILDRGYSATINVGDNNVEIKYGADKFAKYDGEKPQVIQISSTR